jgi:hypothetical protein
MDIQTLTKEELKSLYDKDFYQWILENLGLLKAKEYTFVDWEHLLEEIEDMANRYLDAVTSHMGIILEHLYKWEYFKEDETMGNGWVKSILNSRDSIFDIFEKSPSLKHKAPNYVKTAWEYATRRLVSFFEYPENIRLAKKYFGKIPTKDDFPQICPYAFEQILAYKPWLNNEV